MKFKIIKQILDENKKERGLGQTPLQNVAFKDMNPQTARLREIQNSVLQSKTNQQKTLQQVGEGQKDRLLNLVSMKIHQASERIRTEPKEEVRRESVSSSLSVSESHYPLRPQGTQQSSPFQVCAREPEARKRINLSQSQDNTPRQFFLGGGSRLTQFQNHHQSVSHLHSISQPSMTSRQLRTQPHFERDQDSGEEASFQVMPKTSSCLQIVYSKVSRNREPDFMKRKNTPPKLVRLENGGLLGESVLRGGSPQGQRLQISSKINLQTAPDHQGVIFSKSYFPLKTPVTLKMSSITSRDYVRKKNVNLLSQIIKSNKQKRDEPTPEKYVNRYIYPIF